MLKLFRTKKRWVRVLMALIVAPIAMAMLIYLVPGAGGDGNSREPEGVLARIDNQAVTSEAAQRRFQSISEEMGGQASPFRKLMMERIVEELILNRAVAYEAERLGFGITPEETAARLRQISLFYPGGEFIGEERYRQTIQQQFNMSVPEFEAELRRQALETKVFLWITGGLSVSPAEVEEEFRRRNQRVQIQYVRFRPEEFSRSLTPDEKAVAAYFEQNRERYQVPERRRVRYLAIDYPTLSQRLGLTRQELESYYQRNRENYFLPERARVRHLFFLAATPEERAPARQKAEAALGELRRGRDFAALAKARSEDENSRERGGEIGWIQRGQTAPELERVLFGAAPGSPPQLVETSYGFHIAQVLERQPERIQTLEEVRPAIERLLRQQKLQQTAEQQAKAVVEAMRGGKNLEAAAGELDWSVLDSPLFALNERLPEFGESTDFQEAAFRLPAESAGQPSAPPSEPVSLPPGFAVLQLQEVVPAHAATLEEVRAQAQQDARGERGRELAREAAQRLAEAAAQRRSLRSAAQALGTSTQTSEKFTRAGSLPGIGLESQPGRPGVERVRHHLGEDGLFQGARIGVANVLEQVLQIDPRLAHRNLPAGLYFVAGSGVEPAAGLVASTEDLWAWPGRPR